MSSFHDSHRSAGVCRGPAVVLACLVFIGLLTGILLSCDARNQYSFRIPQLGTRTEITGSITVLLPAYLLSACAVFINRPVLILPIAFWKVFSVGFVFSGLMFSGGSAGWLVACLTMFAGVCSMPVLCWYWLRCIGIRHFVLRDFLVGLCFLLVIGLADFFVIAPFLSNILIF